MKRWFVGWMILFMIFSMVFMVGLEWASAQQYLQFVGRVVSIHRGTLSVKGSKGEVMYFAVGRRTIYVPPRLPGVNERVKVDYFLRRGHNVAYQVEVLPQPPAKKK